VFVVFRFVSREETAMLFESLDEHIIVEILKNVIQIEGNLRILVLSRVNKRFYTAALSPLLWPVLSNRILRGRCETKVLIRKSLNWSHHRLQTMI